VSHTGAASGYVDQAIGKIAKGLINPAIYLLFALALASFVFGVAKFVRSADDPGARKTGQQHMLWGIVGMAIMVSVFTIIRLVVENIGAEVPSTIPGK